MGTIRIRMYRVGFGDCFLISFLDQKNVGNSKYHHVLVDCGVHSKGNIGTLDQVVNDILLATGGKLAIIIATHAHQDHISGFSSKFSKFDIGEIWLPWTWDPNDHLAVQLQKKQKALVEQLRFSISTIEQDQGALNAISNLCDNENAVSLLKSGFGTNAQIRYLKAGDLFGSNIQNDPAAIPIPNLTINILGPPISEGFLAKMDALLRVNFRGDSMFERALLPMQGGIAREDYSLKIFNFGSKDEKTMQNRVSFPLKDLIFALDKARNNESIIALFAFRGQYLLFSGDAERDNWEWWTEILDKEGILSQLTFYKVSHHGSASGTPTDTVEKMVKGSFAAMVSTQSIPWSSFPNNRLMAELNSKTDQQIVRSDWVKLKGAPDPVSGTEPPLPSALPSGFSEGPFWIDYTINL